MIKTAMTELFGIQHPIMLAGMNWISTPQISGGGFQRRRRWERWPRRP